MVRAFVFVEHRRKKCRPVVCLYLYVQYVMTLDTVTSNK